MSFFDWIVRIVSEYWQSFLRGTGNTLIMSIIGTVAGFLIGLLIGAARTIPVTRRNAWILKPLGVVMTVYVEVIRGTPMLVQALIVHYGWFARIGMPSLLSAVIIISVNTGAYMAEIVRGGILSVEKGQTEGSMAIGLSHAQTMLYVVLPQAVRNIMPSIGNEFVVNIKDSSVLSVISITELMFTAKQAGGTYMQFVPSYCVCAVIYFILTFAVTRLLRLAEKKMDRTRDRAVCGSQTDFRSQINIPEEGIPED